MHSVSASSSRVSVTQPESRLNWGSQLGKSAALAASSVGLGWLIGRLWKGTDKQPIGQTGSSDQLAVYREEQKDHHWSNAGSFSVESSEIFGCGLQPESSFHKIGIVYKSSVQEAVRSPALSAENSNFHVLSACSLVGGLLMGGNIPQFPLMVPLLALSMSKSVEALNYGDDNPIGTVIATFSSKAPDDYLRCDGAQYHKDAYPELYDALGEEYRVGGGIFRVPDCEGLFLRGTNDVSKIGERFEYTTGAPRNNPFKAKDSGVHVHTTHLSGEHSHKLDLSGEHTHSVTSEGQHVHEINIDGEHSHTMKTGGRHNHNAGESDEYQLLAKIDGTGTATAGGTCSDPLEKKPNLMKMWPNRWHGGHEHEINDNGGHTHSMKSEGSHAHTLNTVDPHTHTVSTETAHSHKISSAGEHVHEIVGGDAETSPKNMKVAYLIKAKRAENGSPVVTSTNGFITPQSVVLSLVTSIFGFFVARMRR